MGRLGSGVGGIWVGFGGVQVRGLGRSEGLGEFGSRVGTGELEGLGHWGWGVGWG